MYLKQISKGEILIKTRGINNDETLRCEGKSNSSKEGNVFETNKQRGNIN